MGFGLLAIKYGSAEKMTLEVVIVLLAHFLLGSCALEEYPEYGVYLTVSSFTSLVTYGQFEVNWFGIGEERFGTVYVGIIKDGSPERKLLSVWPVTSSEGRHTSSVDAPHFDLATLMKRRCLGYSAALLEKAKGENKYTIRRTSCFAPRPNWMRKHCRALSSLPLNKMLIPGTHNSGMYNLGYAHPHEKLYLYNQDQNIRRQLAYGIRGLDLRVQYYNEDFYVTHDTVRGWVTIRDVLRDVLWFVNATGELVLLDFHRFTTGFGKEHGLKRHEELQALIVEELKDVLLGSYAWRRKFGDIFCNCTKTKRKNGRVIVFYNEVFAPKYVDYLSQGVYQMWPNAQTPRELITYLDREACVGHYLVFGIMAELTASFPKLIVGNRVAAEWINRIVTEYFRKNYKKCRGIIYTDFFLGNNIIKVAIRANLAIAQEHQKA
uniref:Phosphatidylinositol-specific phospholipase C X domain-containing protein n=1 Tax=Amblyomma maculatum TaxID=34609 RepID=G3ML17_AMBMU